MSTRKTGAPPAGETAKDRRNRERREARAAAKAARSNGHVTEAPAEGVFIAIQRLDDGLGGLSVLGTIPQGDIRPAEVLSILEKACTVERRKLEA